MKNEIITGGVLVAIVGGGWLLLSRDISIEEIANDLSKNTPISTPLVTTDIFENSLSVDYENLSTIDTDVFIGDSAEEGDKSGENIAFANKYNALFEKKDFIALCEMREDCNAKTEDPLVLKRKEKDYKSHSFKYWQSDIDNSVVCYEESIRLKNDGNKNPIIYTYHVEVAKNLENSEKLAFKKSRCEKVIKLPYGDITNRDPYDKRCGANVTRILCEK